jgi:4-hydroxy-tetrahydrodipicolinate reductase
MNPAPIAVAVIGAAGRLGQFACRVFDGDPRWRLVARYEHGERWPHELSASGAQIAFEATRAGLGFEHGRQILAAGVRPLIATSGVSVDEVGELDRLARERQLGGLVVPNFSVGAWLLARAAELAAAHFEQVELLEAHHPRKADAPSGTAARRPSAPCRRRRRAETFAKASPSTPCDFRACTRARKPISRARASCSCCAMR